MADKEKQQNVSDPKNMCRYCKKSVANSVAKCVTCDACYHTACALRIAGLTAIGKDNLVNCCGNRPTKTTQSQGDNLTTVNTCEESIWRKLLETKDEVIAELREKQTLLYKTITLLEHKHTAVVKDSLSAGRKEQKTDADKNHNSDKNVNKQVNTNVMIPNIETSNKTLRENSVLELDYLQRKKMQSIINLGATSEADGVQDPFIPVAERRRRSFPRKRFGTGAVTIEEKTSGFAGGDRKAWIYIYRVKSHVTEEMVRAHIERKPGFSDLEVGVKEVIHEGRKFDYKSFSISVPFEKKDEVYQPEFWPSNIGIKRFNFRLYNKSRPGADFLENTN